MSERNFTPEGAYDFYPTEHEINGQKIKIHYLGEGEWQLDDRVVLFSGGKDELIKDLKEHKINL